MLSSVRSPGWDVACAGVDYRRCLPGHKSKMNEGQFLLRARFPGRYAHDRAHGWLYLILRDGTMSLQPKATHSSRYR